MVLKLSIYVFTWLKAYFFICFHQPSLLAEIPHTSTATMSLAAAGPKPVAGGTTRHRAESLEDLVPVSVSNKEENRLSVCHSGIFFMDDLNCGDNGYTKFDDEEDGGKRESGTGSNDADAAADDDDVDGGNNSRLEDHRGRVNGEGRNLSGDSGRESKRNAEEEQMDVIFRLIDEKDIEGVRGIMKSGKINKNAKNNVSDIHQSKM